MALVCIDDETEMSMCSAQCSYITGKPFVTSETKLKISVIVQCNIYVNHWFWVDTTEIYVDRLYVQNLTYYCHIL